MNADTPAESARRRAQVADVVAFLASPAADDVTAQVIDVGPRE
jgi:NAD(P)-dependent dehydrogenase (short-subunit alcohol dehydrogenase family)